MNDFIQTFVLYAVVDQVLESVFGVEPLGTVQIQGEPAVQIGVHPQTFLDEFRIDVIFREQLIVRYEFDLRSVAFFGVAAVLPDKFSPFEFGAFEFAVAVRGGDEPFGKRIDRFGSDAVQTDGELEYVAVVFCSGIDL